MFGEISRRSGFLHFCFKRFYFSSGGAPECRPCLGSVVVAVVAAVADAAEVPVVVALRA